MIRVNLRSSAADYLYAATAAATGRVPLGDRIDSREVNPSWALTFAHINHKLCPNFGSPYFAARALSCQPQAETIGKVDVDRGFN
jgi:hypothetical protein